MGNNRLAQFSKHGKLMPQFAWSRALQLTHASLLIAGVVLHTGSAARAQTTERTAKGPANKDIRIGLFVNVQPDCTSGPLPTIRLERPPENGKVTVKPGRIKATNYKQCLALE